MFFSCLKGESHLFLWHLTKCLSVKLPCRSLRFRFAKQTSPNLYIPPFQSSTPTISVQLYDHLKILLWRFVCTRMGSHVCTELVHSPACLHPGCASCPLACSVVHNQPCTAAQRDPESPCFNGMGWSQGRI